MLKSVLFIACALCTSALAAELPSGLQACSRDDPKLNECMTKQLESAFKLYAKGSKELGLISLDPLEIDEMSVTGKGSVHVNQTYKNIKMYGLVTDTAVNKLELDLDKCHLDLVVTSKKLTMLADYSVKGQLLLFPVNSQGKSNFTLSDLRIRHEFHCEKITRNGNEHLHITDYSVNFEDYNIIMHFEDPAGIHDDVTKRVHEVIAMNSNEIFDELKGPHEEAYASIGTRVFNNVFDKFTYKELFP